MLVANWVIERRVHGWSNPPSGLGVPVERWVAQSPDDKNVSVWIEAEALQLLDDEQYYPGGCYSIPIVVLLKLQELACES
jgi:hypothetical protein